MNAETAPRKTGEAKTARPGPSKDGTKHAWEPTDSQGHSMECSTCALAISIQEADRWDANLYAKCPGRKE